MASMAVVFMGKARAMAPSRMATAKSCQEIPRGPASSATWTTPAAPTSMSFNSADDNVATDVGRPR